MPDGEKWRHPTLGNRLFWPLPLKVYSMDHAKIAVHKNRYIINKNNRGP